MRRYKCRTPEFGDASRTTESPQSNITQTNNKIGIMFDKLIPKSVELRGELGADKVTGGSGAGFVEGKLKRWVAGESIRFGSEEMGEVVTGRVEVEDVGAMDFGVVGPDCDDVAIVVGAIVEVDESMINWGEVD